MRSLRGLTTAAAAAAAGGGGGGLDARALMVVLQGALTLALRKKKGELPLTPQQKVL